MMTILEYSKRMLEFYNTLGIPTYRGKAPEEATLPYIIYDLNINEVTEVYLASIKIYDKSESYANLTNIVDSLGSRLPCSYINSFYIDKGSPFIVDLPEEDPTVKGFLVNLLITANYH